MIRCENVHKHFGGVHAVDGATLEIAEGSITGLIGPNGAGKTTLFNCIAGAFPPTSGKIMLGGEDITGLPRMSFSERDYFAPSRSHMSFPPFRCGKT